MNEALVQQLLAQARKYLLAGDKASAIAWHAMAKDAKACSHKI
ncbi:hypothetical protein [Pseudomonas sp.]